MKRTADAACAAPLRHSTKPATRARTLCEAEVLQVQPLPLDRSPSDSSNISFSASICRGRVPESVYQAVGPSMPTEGQLSPMIQQRKRKHPAEPPAAPGRKLPQHAFHHKAPTRCGSTPATPILQCKSESSMSLHQNCYLQSEALQAQTITSLLQDASRAASMSKLVARASPVSSAEHLLQRLRSGGVGARVNASNGHEQLCGNFVIPALASCRPCHTGAAARHARAVGQGCPTCSPAYTVHREIGSFCGDQEARPQPSTCACAGELVHRCLAQSHRQTEGYGDSEQHDKQAAERQL